VNRVVLLADRSGDPQARHRLALSMTRVTAAGGRVVAVVSPADFRQAHRLIADDQADTIVSTIVDTEFTSRTAPDPGAVFTPRQRRPRPVGGAW
jgi:hypothetical protein